MTERYVKMANPSSHLSDILDCVILLKSNKANFRWSLLFSRLPELLILRDKHKIQQDTIYMEFVIPLAVECYAMHLCLKMTHNKLCKLL